MSNPERRPLTESEITHAENLRLVFDRWQADRKALKLRASQQVVADELEISQSAFSQFMRQITVPSIVMWSKICKFFEIDPSEIGAELAEEIKGIGAVVQEPPAVVSSVKGKWPFVTITPEQYDQATVEMKEDFEDYIRMKLAKLREARKSAA